ncbi:MAG TPA: DUF4386 domain-containing protein, partial [Ornithinicoccus sp.]|nr:DUF4386 domain-containing protein [Ornithinicoccus sp.]
GAARWAGWMYLLTFVSIPTVALYAPVREAGFVTGPGPDTGVLVGGALELVVGLACIGTAVALFPVVRRQGEALATGFVGTRILEGTLIFVGVASLWTIVSLRQDGAGADAVVVGEALTAFYDGVFIVSQGLIPVANALLLGTLLYRSRLVPRVLPVLGFVGAATRWPTTPRPSSASPGAWPRSWPWPRCCRSPRGSSPSGCTSWSRASGRPLSPLSAQGAR